MAGMFAWIKIVNYLCPCKLRLLTHPSLDPTIFFTRLLFMKNSVTLPEGFSETELIYIIRGCAYNVRNEFGRFLHERPYQKAMEYSLRKAGLKAMREVPIHVIYDGIDCGRGFSVDLLLPHNIVVELKATPEMEDIQFAQLRNYMNLLHSPLGILINFGVQDFRNGIHVMRAVPCQFPKNKAYPVIDRKNN